MEPSGPMAVSEEPSTDQPTTGGEAPRRIRLDVLLALLLAIGTTGTAFRGSGQLMPQLVNRELADFWFDGDTARLFRQVTDPKVVQRRTAVHPLFSLIVYTATQLVQRVSGAEPLAAVRIVTAVAAGVAIATLFGVLRLLGCPRSDAMLFTLVGATSAWAVFWLPVLESHTWSGISILVALGTAALAELRPLGSGWFMSASALTLAFTITDWMAGIFATFVALPWRRAIQTTVNAFCLVVVLVGVQKAIMPSARLFFEDPVELVHGQRAWIRRPQHGGPKPVLRSFVVHSMVMPHIQEGKFGQLNGISVLHSRGGSGSAVGKVAVTVWGGLLILGLWGLAFGTASRRLRVLLALCLAGQLMVFLVYGQETFLFSARFGPLLVILAALGTTTPARPLALALAALLVVGAAVNNGAQYARAVDLVQRQAGQSGR